MTLRTVQRATLSALAIARLPWPSVCNWRIAVRIASSSMAGLPIKTVEQTLDIRLGARHGLVDFRAFDCEQLLEQALFERAARPARNSAKGPQIVEPGLGRGGLGRLRGRLRVPL